MAEGRKKLDLVLRQLLKMVKPGISLREIEDLAVKLIRQQGARPSFAMVPRYHWATCININQGVVHGVPSDYKIQEGDLVSIDTGVYYKGFHTDAAWTVIAQSQKSCLPAGTAKVKSQNLLEKEKFLMAGVDALEKAVRAARPGNRIGHISQTIEKILRRAGYSPVRELTGHGIGRQLHEPPLIPGLVSEKIPHTALIKKGMAFALEVIYTLKPAGLVLAHDGWTVKTANGALAALFEKTIFIQ